MNVDRLLIEASKPKPNRYNCFDFAREVWREATGEDLGDRVPDAINRYRQAVERNAETRFRLAEPESPCLIVFPARRATPHIGVYYGGKVLHYQDKQAYSERLDAMEARLGKGMYLK